MAYKNKADQAAAARRHYEANRAAMIRRAGEHRKAHRKKLRAYVDSKKAAPCMDCGGTFPPCAMQFDHVRGEKLRNIGDMVVDGVSYKVIDEEIAKCELVCANCHAVRTQQRQGRAQNEEGHPDVGLTLF